MKFTLFVAFTSLRIKFKLSKASALTLRVSYMLLALGLDMLKDAVVCKSLTEVDLPRDFLVLRGEIRGKFVAPRYVSWTPDAFFIKVATLKGS